MVACDSEICTSVAWLPTVTSTIMGKAPAGTAFVLSVLVSAS